jgi:hypothetical protein
MIEWIARALGPLIFYFLDKWMKAQKQEEEMVQSYYAFLDKVDLSGKGKVSTHLAGENAKEQMQKQLLKELEDEQKDKG